MSPAVSGPQSLQSGRWGSGNPAFTMPTGSRPAYDQAVSSYPAFPHMLFSPLAFAFR